MKGNGNDRPNRKGNRSGATDGSSVGRSFTTKFVDLPLSEQDKAAIKERKTSGSFRFEELLPLLEEGYKISVGWNSKTKSFICAITDVFEGRPTYNTCFSSFGGDAETALLVALYKWETYCEGREEWASASPDETAFG